MDERRPESDPGGSGEGSSEPTDEPGNLPGDSGGSLDEADREATRYLAAATQLDLKYARFVVSQIVGEPFRAIAPAVGVDLVVVTRWALAALRRRALRDGVLTCLLVAGVAIAVGAWTWIPIVVMAALAVFVIAYERWVRDVKILPRLMIRGWFRACDAPLSPSRRIERRLAVARQQQKGNLVVFRGPSSFVGSGERVVNGRILVNVARGKKGADGKRQQPIPFSIPQLHAALEMALKNMDFPDTRVEQRLYVNGEDVASDPRLLLDMLGPPVANAPSDFLHYGSIQLIPEARTYVCAEFGGWKGQLVVSLFAHAVQAHGSLQVEWMFYVLPPLRDNLLMIDRLYEQPVTRQFTKEMASGLLGFAPALVWAPVTFARYVILPLTEMARMRSQSYRIRHGYDFNYGALRSIREDPINYRRAHNFAKGDQLTFIMLTRHTLRRALEEFLEEHKVDVKQFASQEQHELTANEGSGLQEIHGQADETLPVTEHFPPLWKRSSGKVWVAIGGVIIAAVGALLGAWLIAFAGPSAPTLTAPSSVSPIGNPGHSPGRQDVSTMLSGHRFYAVPNFYDYQKCGRPCWLPLFKMPTEGSVPVTQGWPCEYYDPRISSAGPYCIQPPPGRTPSERASGPDKDSGDRILVICQTTQVGPGVPAQTISNEIGQSSNIWDKIAVPATYIFHYNTVKGKLTPVQGMPGFYEAFGADIWLGATGWHSIPCSL